MAETTEQLAQISDRLLDVCLTSDLKYEIACEAPVRENTVKVTGEITTAGKIDFNNIVRKTVESIGFDLFVVDLNSTEHEDGITVGNKGPCDGNQDSDKTLNAHLALNCKRRVACESCVKDNLMMVAGKINVSEKIECDNVAQKTLKNIGFESFTAVICDQVSDETADDCFTLDPKCRVTYRTSTKVNMKITAGEINVDEKTWYEIEEQIIVKPSFSLCKKSVKDNMEMVTDEWNVGEKTRYEIIEQTIVEPSFSLYKTYMKDNMVMVEGEFNIGEKTTTKSLSK